MPYSLLAHTGQHPCLLCIHPKQAFYKRSSLLYTLMQVQEGRAAPAASLLDHLWEKKMLDWPSIALKIRKLALPVEPSSVLLFLAVLIQRGGTTSI